MTKLREFAHRNGTIVRLVVEDFGVAAGSLNDRLQPASTKRERETAKRRELGLCIKCGKPAAPKATCAECGIKANARRKPRAS